MGYHAPVREDVESLQARAPIRLSVSLWESLSLV
jgi:hypothetical protein